MAIFNIYFSSCVLLLLLTLGTRTSLGLPVRAPSAEACTNCSSLFKNLLLNVSDLLDNDVLCYGIHSDKIVVRSKTDTVLACAPNLAQNQGCMMQRHSTFSESECLSNITKDLAHYAAAIDSYMDSQLRSPEEEAPLLRPTLGIIKSLGENCSLMPGEKDSSKEDVAQLWGDNSFSNRQEMCKMMRGFYVRTITINRALGYIASGDHRK